MKNADHVVWKLPGRQDYMDWECLGCGAKVAIGLPIGVSDLAALSNAFTLRHQSCWRKQKSWFLRMAPNMIQVGAWESEGGR